MQTNFFGMFVLFKQVEFMMEDFRDFLIYTSNWKLKPILEVHGVDILPFLSSRILLFLLALFD
jgi:hypothetical protein